MAIDAVTPIAGKEATAAADGAGSSGPTEAELRAAAIQQAKLDSAMEGVLVGFMFAQLGDMRRTVSETSSKSKERLSEMKELDSELEQ
jgi:hypothetical protein